jgi:hypothetical protein
VKRAREPYDAGMTEGSELQMQYLVSRDLTEIVCGDDDAIFVLDA